MNFSKNSISLKATPFRQSNRKGERNTKSTFERFKDGNSELELAMTGQDSLGLAERSPSTGKAFLLQIFSSEEPGICVSSPQRSARHEQGKRSSSNTKLLKIRNPRCGSAGYEPDQHP